MSDDGMFLLVYNTDAGFSVYSFLSNKVIYNYAHDTVTGEIPLGVALSPDGKTVAMGLKRGEKLDIILFEQSYARKRIIKTYDIDIANLNLQFAEGDKSLLIAFSGTQSGFPVRERELVNIHSGERIDLIGGLQGNVRSRLFKNDGLIISTTTDGGMTMSDYPFSSFIRMNGHRDLIRL